MQLIHKLLFRNRTRVSRLNQGLSTAELVGIIVIVGILGALGGTYVSGLVATANTNSGNQNAVTLNTVANSYIAAGGGTLGTVALDTTAPGTNAITQLNNGVTSPDGILFQMTPPISAASATNYTISTTTASGGTNIIVSFTHTEGTAP